VTIVAVGTPQTSNDAGIESSGTHYAAHFVQSIRAWVYQNPLTHSQDADFDNQEREHARDAHIQMLPPGLSRQAERRQQRARAEESSGWAKTKGDQHASELGCNQGQVEPA
jgi:hypothetical protein